MSDNVRLGNLSIRIEQSADTVTYTFVGEVDEHFRQKDVPRVNKPVIVLNLEKVDNFNSCGIREWIYLIKDLGHVGRLIFKSCSVAMIDQVNMVPDSLGSGEIESFLAPYYCHTHGEITKLIDMKEHASEISQKIAPEFSCDQCGKPLEFDALEESYFLFGDNTLSRSRAS